MSAYISCQGFTFISGKRHHRSIKTKCPFQEVDSTMKSDTRRTAMIKEHDMEKTRQHTQIPFAMRILITNYGSALNSSERNTLRLDIVRFMRPPMTSIRYSIIVKKYLPMRNFESFRKIYIFYKGHQASVSMSIINILGDSALSFSTLPFKLYFAIWNQRKYVLGLLTLMHNSSSVKTLQ